jgi:hypothetical protein
MSRGLAKPEFYRTPAEDTAVVLRGKLREQESERVDGDGPVTHYQLVCLENGMVAHTSWHTDQTRAVGAWNRRSSDDDKG